MGRYDNLLQQLYDKEFSDLRFTVYNFIESDGYVDEISAINGKKYDIDDFGFIVFDIPEDDKKGIKCGNAVTIQKYRVFKHYIENECQNKPECAIFIMKELGIVIAVKLKSYNINKMLEV